MKKLLVVLGGIVTLALGVWLGLRVPPRPLPAPALAASEPPTVPVPDGLPAPVARFYRELYGERLPVIDSAIVSGRGTMRVNGVTLPVRFRFTHDTGRAYRHHIEATLYGLRVLTVHETFLDGSARLELPFGVSAGPQIDQGANLALWAEAIWMPAVWATDPQVRWSPVDDVTALLTVPFGATEETFVARFDAATGLLHTLESMRYKGETGGKTLWINEVVDWGEVDGWTMPARGALTWLDDGSPWAQLTTEQVAYNVELGDYLSQRGP